MYFLGAILKTIAFVLDSLLTFFIIITILRAVISWVNPDPYNPIVRFLTASTDPLLAYIKRFMPKMDLPIDFSPLILIILLQALRILLVDPLNSYGYHLQVGPGRSVLNASEAPLTLS